MRAVVFFSAVLCVASSASAQVIRSFGSVVFPGGTWATTPGTIRNFGSVVFPGSSNVPIVRTGPAAPLTPAVIATGQVNRNGQFGNGQFGNGQFGNGQFGNRGNRNNRNRFNNNNGNNTFVYAFPYFIGGGYDNSFLGSDPPTAPSGPPPMAMYPPDMPRPAMVQVAPAMSAYQGAPGPAAANAGDDSAPDSERYLIAFKDHTVYSAVAYWFDGDTLHYFTPGNVHNQVSLSLVDRDLTTRLNKELGIDFQIPQGK